MAKQSSVNKNNRRREMVKKYAPKYAALKATANDKSLDEGERSRACRWRSCRATATRRGSAIGAN